MATDHSGSGRLPAAYLTPGSSSFAEFLGSHAPELLPGRRTPPATALTTEAPHGTTIVALTFPGGIVMAGDRRATMGNYIAQRDIEKVFHADDYSCVGIAGRGRHRDRDGPAVPGRARALREDRGRHALPRGQGQPARPDDPRQPGDGHAGPRGRPAVRRLRPRRRRPGAGRPAVLLRRHRRPLRGAQVPLRRLRLAVRPRRAEEALARGALRRRRHAVRASSRSTTPPTRTPPPAAPTSPAGSSRSSPIVTAEGYRRLSDDEVGAIVDVVVSRPRCRTPADRRRRCDDRHRDHPLAAVKETAS